MKEGPLAPGANSPRLRRPFLYALVTATAIGGAVAHGTSGVLKKIQSVFAGETRDPRDPRDGSGMPMHIRNMDLSHDPVYTEGLQLIREQMTLLYREHFGEPSANEADDVIDLMMDDLPGCKEMDRDFLRKEMKARFSSSSLLSLDELTKRALKEFDDSYRELLVQHGPGGVDRSTVWTMVTGHSDLLQVNRQIEQAGQTRFIGSLRMAVLDLWKKHDNHRNETASGD